VSIAIQFTSQVLPPFVENDCSNLQDCGLMSDMMKRTRTGRPLKSSWSKNSPRPFLNSPTVGVPSVPPLLLAKFKLHLCVSGLYKRRFSAWIELAHRPPVPPNWRGRPRFFAQLSCRRNQPIRWSRSTAASVSTGVCASFQIPNRNHVARRAPMPPGRLRMPVGRFRHQPRHPARARRLRSRSATNPKIHESSSSLERP